MECEIKMNDAIIAPKIKIYTSCHKERETIASNILTPNRVGAQSAAQPAEGMARDDRGENISAKNPRYCEPTARSRASMKSKSSPDIKIFLSCHKDCHIPKNSLFFPVQAGTSLAAQEFPDMLHDNTGNNISQKNKSYCELTTQYWAWKNVDADYYGFFHYRRYFSFAEKIYPANAFGDVYAPCNTDAILEKYTVNEAKMREIIPRYDAIIPVEGGFEEKGLDLYRQYCIAPAHHRSDLDFVLKVIQDEYPAMYPYAIRYLHRKKGYFCNMFIMKKELFGRYCEWLFDILEKHERATDLSDYSEQAYRVHGFLAERLCGIYLYYLEKTSKLKFLKLQRVFFENVEQEQAIRPAFSEQNIPVVFSANNYYIPYLSALLQSLVENSTPAHNYDLIILHRDIDEKNRRLLTQQISRDNISLRFYDVTRTMSTYDNLPLRGHFKIETYFRLLLPELLTEYDKILYLDSDMIVQTDVAELYKTDIKNYLVAACKDADTAGLYNGYEPQKKEYMDKVLKITHPYDYFQAGTLLMNLAAFRKIYSTKQMMAYAASFPWELLDQDVLNHLAEGKTLFVDMSWNVMVDWRYIRIRDIIGRAPRRLYYEYLEARKQPKIIHYAGPDKPWTDPESDFAELFWFYSRKTPWYEVTLARLSHSIDASLHPAKKTLSQTIKDSLLRPVVGIFFPLGSERREKLKKLFKRSKY